MSPTLYPAGYSRTIAVPTDAQPLVIPGTSPSFLGGFVVQASPANTATIWIGYDTSIAVGPPGVGFALVPGAPAEISFADAALLFVVGPAGQRITYGDELPALP